MRLWLAPILFALSCTCTSPRLPDGALAFDRAAQRALVFGGRSSSGYLTNEMWAWDGGSWSQVTPPNLPSEREGHSMAWDSARQRLVLFGGFTLTSLQNDTWEWNGLTWAQRLPPLPLPPPREDAMLAFDSARGRLVLFGGQTMNRGPLSDTWEWDGTT